MSQVPTSPSQDLTFGSWQYQLFAACREDRTDDIRSLVSLREPQHVAQQIRELPSITAGRAPGTSTRLVLTSEMRAQTNPRPLPNLPSAGSSQGRRFLDDLLNDEFGSHGPSPFWCGSLSALRLLEAAGADLDTSDVMGTPLLVAMAAAGQTEIVRYLVSDQRQSPNASRFSDGATALHVAADRAMVELLVHLDADVHAETYQGDSVLARLVERRATEAVDYLLSLRPAVSAANLMRCLAVCPAMVDVLCKRGTFAPPSDPNSREPLAMQRLLHRGIEAYHLAPNQPDAKHRDLVACVDVLLNHGWDCYRYDESGRLPIHLVEDMLPDPADPLRVALLDRLGEFDAPRDLTHSPQCECGIH